MENNSATKLMVEKLLSEPVHFVPAKYPDSSNLLRPSSYITISADDGVQKGNVIDENSKYITIQKAKKLQIHGQQQKNGEQPALARPKSLLEALNSYSGNKEGVNKKSKKRKQKKDAQ